MTVGHLVLIVIGIGWMVRTIIAIRTLNNNNDWDEGNAVFIFVLNIILMVCIGGYYLTEYWDLVIF